MGRNKKVQTSVLHCQDFQDSIPSSQFPQFQQPGSPKTYTRMHAFTHLSKWGQIIFQFYCFYKQLIINLNPNLKLSAIFTVIEELYLLYFYTVFTNENIPKRTFCQIQFTFGQNFIPKIWLNTHQVKEKQLFIINNIIIIL